MNIVLRLSEFTELRTVRSNSQEKENKKKLNFPSEY